MLEGLENDKRFFWILRVTVEKIEIKSDFQRPTAFRGLAKIFAFAKGIVN